MIKIIPIISAVILGITMMLLPILLLIPPSQYAPFEATRTGEPTNKLSEDLDVKALGGTETGVAAFPSSLIQAGLVAVLGLVIALGASLYFKRRVLPPFSAYL